MLGFHHFGTFLLFAASILLLISTITAPVVNSLALAKATITIDGYSGTLDLGALGYCLKVNGSSDDCSPTKVGYTLPTVLSTLASATGTISSDAQSTIDAVSKAFVLHPIACGVTFFAFLVAAVSDRLGFLFAALIAALAAVLALVCMVLDLVFFYVVRRYADDQNLDIAVSYSTGTWVTVAAFACLFFSVFFVACACVTDRRRKRRAHPW
ncbi:hypothetical protein JCM21900_000415 [Sporobolomyces salmonicolor]